MDYDRLPTESVAAPLEQAPAGVGGLWQQDSFGNGFLAEQLQSGAANASIFSDIWDGIFGADEAPRVARKGIADAAGQIDRKMAAEELKDRFHVGEGEEQGKATVSQEEYDKLVNLYSDIRMGKTQIDLDTTGMSEKDAAAFRSGTMGDMASLLQTPSGRALLDDLAHGNNGHRTTLGGTAGKPDTKASLPGLDMGDIDDRWKLDRALHDHCGADSRVSYQPGQTVHTAHDGDIRSDVTLYHELAHAWHNGHGQAARGAVSGTDGEEVELAEFETVGMKGYENLPYTENRYRAERDRMGDRLGARKTYGGTKPEDHDL